MPESTVRQRRFGALAATLALGLTVGLPTAMAQTGPPPTAPPSNVSDPKDWSPSRFTDPFSGDEARVATESFPITGSFEKQTSNEAERIVSVRVTFGRPGGTTPDPTDDCIPDDPPAYVQEGTYNDGIARYDFRVPADVSTWPCNGRFVVTGAGQSNQEPGPYMIKGRLTVVVPPIPVSVVSATADEAEMTVTVNWEPLATADLAIDAVGYRIERAGPMQPDGTYGAYTALGTDLDVDTVPTYRDTLESGGDYRYRVRSLRDGPDSLIPAPASSTAVAEASLPGGPVATTSTTEPPTVPSLGGAGGSVNIPRRAPAPRLPASTTPTTLDTGFDSELDYGDRPLDDGPGELASEGQSVIRTPGEGAGLLAPIAGALVLVGWAGHVMYLNRLAKQF